MALAESDFEFLRRFMLRNSAMVLEEHNACLAETRLSALVSNENLGSIPDLVRRLKIDSYGSLRGKVVDALTNHETWFFRDYAPFELLRTELLPSFRQQKAGTLINVWSAASSTGQEASSIAMLACEMWPDATKHLRIIGTDISEGVLNRARLGRYSQFEVNRGLPAYYLARYFRRDNMEWELVPEIRRMIEFRFLNLADPWPPLPPMDIVLLRNVLIYFTQEKKCEILQRLHRSLASGGCLLLGAAETTLGLHAGFQRVAGKQYSYYRKV